MGWDIGGLDILGLSRLRSLQAPATAPLAAPPLEAPMGPRLAVDTLALGTDAKSHTTVTEARAGAEAAWMADKTIPSSPYRAVVADFADANAPLSPAARRQVMVELSANQGLESKALAQLDRAQQEAYARLSTGLKDDPGARLAQRLLLLEGKLTGGEQAHDGKNLLGQLDALATQPLHPDIPRDQLLGQLVNEIAEPSRISQQNKATCMFSSIQIKLVMENPAEYARLVMGLASPDGKVVMAGGRTLERDATTLKEDGSQRAIPTRLFVPALMTASFEGRNKYDNLHDGNNPGPQGADNALHQLSGKTVERLGFPIDPRRMAELMPEILGKLKEWTSEGKSAPVSMYWGTPGSDGRIDELHEILLTAMENDQVHYQNPWGTQETMSLQDFQDRLAMPMGTVSF